MKGVILAGGRGTRLRPLTTITNKHLLPVFDKPMIMYPLDTLRRSGITDILLVCGKEHAGHFMNFLGSGRDMGVTLSYALQDRDNGGIADALSYAENFAKGEAIAVILGDNIFEHDFRESIQNFKKGTVVFLKEVPDPQRFGTPVFSPAGDKVLSIQEKPKVATSPYGQVGFYLFDQNVFDIIRTQQPSARGELEIADTVNEYIRRGEAAHEFVRGFWSDAGTLESLAHTSEWFHHKAQNTVGYHTHEHIKVRHVGVVATGAHRDPVRGDLFVAEALRHIPFDIKRVYFMNNISSRTPTRGGHAHKIKKQVIFCLSGSFRLGLDDGTVKQTVVVSSAAEGVYIGPRVWITMEDFSDNCVVLVVASEYYDPDDYIKTYEEFLTYIT